MFRYIAIAWDDSSSLQAATAQHLSLRWQQQPGWHAALMRPGLHMFSIGLRSGNNESHTLQGGLGVVLGRLFRRTDFDSTPAPRATLSSADATIILNSQGRILIDRFWGRYVAFMQTAVGSTLVIRDPSGTLPCFLIRHRGASIVFSWLEDALQMLAGEAHFTVNWDLLLAQALQGPVDGKETALEEVSQVLPGEALDLHLGQSTLLWSAVDIARTPSSCNAIEATQLLGHAVRSCTRTWAGCYDAVLLRLSGGVDSSILLSCLSPGDTTADVICINYHSPGSDSDERHYAVLAAGRMGRDLLLRERDTGFRIERALQMARMPCPTPYLGRMNASTDAQAAAAYGAAAMFTGAGGDALFYELPRWWPAADYLHQEGFNLGFPAAVLDAARLGKLSFWRTLGLALRARIDPHLYERAPKNSASLLAPGLVKDKATELRFVHPALREATDLPIGKYMQTVALMHPTSYYDPFEQASAPELVHPLLSQPLVELSLRLPSYVLTQGGRGRALARNAFAAQLPGQIINRRSKGGMEEHIKAVLRGNADFVRSLLLEGALCRRGLLDRPKLEALLSGRLTSLEYSPSQIHGLVAIEAWLTHWAQ